MKKVISLILKNVDQNINSMAGLEQIVCESANELVDIMKEKKDNYLLQHLKLVNVIAYDGFNVVLEENVEVYEMYFIEF